MVIPPQNDSHSLFFVAEETLGIVAVSPVTSHQDLQAYLIDSHDHHQANNKHAPWSFDEEFQQWVPDVKDVKDHFVEDPSVRAVDRASDTINDLMTDDDEATQPHAGSPGDSQITTFEADDEMKAFKSNDDEPFAAREAIERRAAPAGKNMESKQPEPPSARASTFLGRELKNAEAEDVLSSLRVSHVGRP